MFFHLGTADITSANEGQRATPPIEMLQTGDFVIPTINREAYIKKPPLLYWAIAGLYAATGVINETTARAPTAICGLILLLGVYFHARRAVGEREARWAAAILLAMPLFLRRSQVSDLDMPLALACFLAIVTMWSAMESQGRRRWALAAVGGVAFGAAILLKGPVPFLFLVTAWAAHMAAHGKCEPGTIRGALIWTTALFAGDWILNAVLLLIPENATSLVHRVLSLPYGLTGVLGLWLWLAWRVGPADRTRRVGVLAVVVAIGVALALPWIAAVLTRLGWEYASGVLFGQAIQRTYYATQINSGVHWFYLAGLSYYMAPWSLLTPLFFSPRLRPTAPGWIAAGLTAVVSITVFSLIAGKEQDYILPSYSFAAIAFGGVLVAMQRGVDGWAARYATLWGSITMAGLGIGAVGMAVYASWMYRGEVAALIEIWIVAAAGFAAIWSCRRPPRRAWGVAIATILLITQYHILYGVHASGMWSTQDVTLAMRQLREHGLRVEASNVRPAEAFYLRTPIALEPDPHVVAGQLRGAEPYYYLCQARELDALREAAGAEGFLVLAGYYTKGQYALIGNRPLPEGIGGNLRLEGREPD